MKLSAGLVVLRACRLLDVVDHAGHGHEAVDRHAHVAGAGRRHDGPVVRGIDDVGRDPCRSRSGVSAARRCWCGGSAMRLEIGGPPADAFLDLAVGEREDLLLGLQRVLVREVVGGEQHGERIVDEVQLLQAQDGLAVVVQVEAVRIVDAVDRGARLWRRSPG